MADLDSLNLIVRATTKEATDSIDRLIETLGKLGVAFDVQSVDGFAASLKNMANAINSIKGYNLKVISDAVAGLSKASKTMATVSQNAAKSGTAVDSLTKKLADIVNITDKTGLSMLKKEVDSFLHATNGEEVANARHNIEVVAKTFGTVGAEIDKDRERALAFINALNNTKINLPKDWTKEFGDTDYAKKLRGLVGLGRTVGDGSGSDASEIAERLGLGQYNGQDAEAFRDIAVTADLCRQKIEETNDGLLTLDDALRSDGEAAREAADAMQAFNEKLANTLGMTSKQMSSIGSADGFLEDYETQNIALEQFTQNAEKLLAVGNPYQNIVDGLNEMGNVSISPEVIANVDKIRVAVEKIGGRSGSRAGQSMQDISKGLQSLNVPVPEIGDKVAELATGLRKLGSGNMVKAASSLPFIAQSLHHLNNLKLSGNAEQIAELARAIAGFGYAKVEKAVTNLPVLTQELTALITALSKAPAVSTNTVELVKALGAMNVNANHLTPTTRKAGNALDLFSKKAKKAHSASFSLAATIGKIYASYWMIIRLMGMFKSSIDIASDLTETQNVVDHTFGQMKNRMEDFAKTAVETVGMSELTAKKIGSRFQSMGQNMGIPNELIIKTGQFVDEATNGYGKVADSMADVSINLTRLAGDMASFYNVEYADVAEDLEAVFTGMTRPLRKYGLDLTQATLKEWALANGLNADIKEMTQAEKTMLRYQYVMANTTAAHDDFSNTIDTWANQVRIAQENLKRLQVILGQIGINTFKPLVRNFNSAMNDILHLAESTFNSLGTIFGWQVEFKDVGIIDDMADGLEDVSDGYDDAEDSGKKFKNFLLGIDELNLLPDNSDKNKDGGLGDALGAMANGFDDGFANLKKTESGFDSIYDTLFKLGKRIGEVQLDLLKGIDWQSVYDKVESAGRGLAEFLNGYLSDAELFYHKGRFIANGINTVAHAIYGFFHTFDGYQLGKDLGFELNGFTRNLDWDVIKGAAYEMSHDIAETVNGLFENVNWYDVGRTIIEGINTAVLFVSTIWNEIHWDIIGRALGDGLNGLVENWDHEEMARMLHGKIKALFDLANNFLDQADFVELGHKIGQFLTELKLEEFADDFAALLWNVFKAAMELLPTMAAEAPVETALIAAFCGFKYTGFGNSFGSTLAKSITGGLGSAGLRGGLTSVLTMDLEAIVTSGSLLVQATAIGEAIAGAIVAAWVGYNFGLKLHNIIFEGDEMWTENALVEAVKNFWWWDDAFGQMVTDLQTNVEDYDKALDSFYGINADFAKKDFGIQDGMTWEDVRHGIATGSMQFSEAQFEQMKEMLVNSGNSNIDVNDLINSLKDARDNYTNGFAPWLQEQADIQYALKNGAQYADQILEDAYNRYNAAMEKEAELERRRQELYNSPENQRQRYNAQQEMKEEVAAWNELGEARQNFARISNQMPDSVLDFKKTDGLDYAKKSMEKYSSVLSNFSKKSADAMSSAIREVMRFGSLFNEESATIRRQGETMFDSMNKSSGSGIFTGEARAIENLNTKLLTTKTGIESISLAMDEVGNKKDKTTVLKDSFDGVKAKVEEVSSLFTMDNMNMMFSAIPKAFRIAWQEAVNIMKSVWSEMASWINNNARIEIPKTKVADKEFGGQSVQLKIPRFDIGGSIPNNGNLFFANESGAEVVANMGSRTGVMNTDQMEQAIANGMMKALAAGGQNVTVVLEGDASSFFSAMVRENNNAIMRVGASPLRV